MLFKGTRDNAFHSIILPWLGVGRVAFIVSKGWQGRKSLSQWEAELTALRTDAQVEMPGFSRARAATPAQSSEAYPQPERKWKVSGGHTWQVGF